MSMREGAIRLQPLDRSFWARRDDWQWRPPRWLAGFAILIAAAVYFTIAWSARSPALALDEIVMIGNSRSIAGTAEEWSLSGAGFAPGVAVLMAPAWWITDSAVVVYQVGIWITVALALLAIWPLAAIAKRTGLSGPASVIVASVVVLAPARALLANYLVAESGLLLTTAALVVAADRLWARAQVADALLFGGTVGLIVLFHGRGVGTAFAAGVWCLLLLRHKPRAAVVAGISSVVAALCAYLLYRVVTGQVLPGDARVSLAFDALDERDLGASFASAIGQLWYATLAWPAVVVAGGFAVVAWRRRGGMSRLVLLGSSTGLVLSTIQLNPGSDMLRMDPWFYGRYMDPWWTVLAVVGLAVIVRIRWPALTAAVVGASLAVAAGMLIITVPSMPVGMRWVDVHVLGISPWLRLDTYGNGQEQAWGVLVATGLALTLLLVILGLVRAWVIPVVATLWMWLSIAHDIQGIDLRLGERDPNVDTYGLAQLPYDAVIGIDRGAGSAANTLIFSADPRQVLRIDPFSPPDGVDLVFVHWLAADRVPEGAVFYGPTVGDKFVAWVFPGAVADALAEEGLLVDPGAVDTGDSSG